MQKNSSAAEPGRQVPRPALFEPLEPRQLLAGEAFHLAINFQPESATTVPPGYRADIGRVFGRRANALHYGWNVPSEPLAVDHNSALAPDERYDTTTLFNPGAWWAAQVPNGQYQVRLVLADPELDGGTLSLQVEHALAVNNASTSAASPWIEQTVTVDVNDGALGVSNPGSEAVRVAFIEIDSADVGAATGPAVEWTADDAVPARIARVEPGTAQIGDKLYVLGGYRRGDLSVTNSVDVFDLPTQTWTQLAPIPSDAGAAESHAGVATDGERFIYWAGGQRGGGLTAPGTNTVWRYDTSNNTWSHYVDLPEIRYAGGLAYFNGVLYFFGGDDASRSHATSTHWALNTRSRNPSWIERAPLPVANDHHAVAVLSGIIYSIGGETNHGTTYDQHDNLFAYNPWTDTWTRKADLPTPSSHFEAGTHVIGTKILCIAGRVAISADEQTDEVRVYDTLTDTWTVLEDLPDVRLGPTSGVYGGRVYVADGYSRYHGLAAKAFWGTLSGF